RLDSQTEEEFLSYRKRAAFFNGTARSAEGFVGLIFRRPPFIKIPEVRTTSPRRPGNHLTLPSPLPLPSPQPPLPIRLAEGNPPERAPAAPSGVGRALAEFVNDADMLGTTLAGYAKSVVSEVVGVGRAGSLVDWDGSEVQAGLAMDGPSAEQRAYVSLYSAEQ